MHYPYFICERKFHARTNAKITRHWKSTLRQTRIGTFHFLSFPMTTKKLSKLISKRKEEVDRI